MSTINYSVGDKFTIVEEYRAEWERFGEEYHKGVVWTITGLCSLGDILGRWDGPDGSIHEGLFRQSEIEKSSV